MRARIPWKGYALGAVLLLSVHCRGGDHGTNQCVPGTQRTCGCPRPYFHHSPALPTSTQVCDVSGFWNACDCPPDEGESEETGGRGGGGTGGKVATGGTTGNGGGGAGGDGTTGSDGGGIDAAPADAACSNCPDTNQMSDAAAEAGAGD